MAARGPLWQRCIPKYPVYWAGNPQLRTVLPLFWMKMVKPAKPVTKDRVHFIIHPQMSKFDVRNYLEKIYKVPVLDVRTENREGEDIIHPTRKHVVGKKPDYKLAYVQLGEGHTFEFLDIFEGKTLEADKQVEEYMKMSKSQEKIKQKDWEKLTIPPWFR